MPRVPAWIDGTDNGGAIVAIPVVLLLCLALAVVGIVFLRYPEDYGERLYKLHLSSIRLKQTPASSGSRFQVQLAGILCLVMAGLFCYFLIRSL
jgi:hypothetical protein